MHPAPAAESRRAEPARRSTWAWAAPGVVACFFVFVLCSTRSTFFGDTVSYAADVALVFEGSQPNTNLLDFGHLIWRPIGLLTTHPSAAGDDLRRQIAISLIHFNFFASVVCAAAMFILMRLVKGVKPAAAALSCSAFLATNSFINLSRAGTAWIAGLACLLAGCCFALEASKRGSRGMAALAAAFAAVAAMFWAPYILGVIAVTSACLLDWEGKSPARRLVKSAAVIVPVAGLLTVVAFGLAVHARHIGSAAEFWDWVRHAAHGEGRDRQWLRMFFGLPHSFLIMGDDGLLWKQFLFRDPYAGVGWGDVIRASAWKIALFYAAMGATALELARKAPQRRILVWVSAAAVPTLALAALFEAGSMERYLALYPAVFVAFAWVLSRRSVPAARALIVFFCGVLIVGNLWANLKPIIDEHRAANLARVAPIPAPKSGILAVYTLNIKDDLATLYDPNDRSLDSIPSVRPLIPSLAGEVANWKGLFGRILLQTWDRGGGVWVTKRAWAGRPRREWLWVEGDDWRIHWKDIGPVVSRFEVDSGVGGADGFSHIPDTPANRAVALRASAGAR